jgi:hypothetical protein
VASSIGFLVLVRKYGAVLSREALDQANFLDSLPGSLVPPAINRRWPEPVFGNQEEADKEFAEADRLNSKSKANPE